MINQQKSTQKGRAIFSLLARENHGGEASGFELFFALSCLGLLLLLTLLRLSLHLTNLDQSSTATWSDLMTAYFNGLRFDSRIIAYTAFPLLPFIVLQHRSWHRPVQVVYLTAVASLFILLGLIEPIFYREFHQRLNGLVFQYLTENPITVLRMLWHGFPLSRLIVAWGLLSCSSFMALRWLSRAISKEEPSRKSHAKRWFLLLPALLVVILAARGTLRQGPPLRWGDAFTTPSIFANQLGLNPEQTLYTAIVGRLARRKPPLWKNSMAATEAIRIVRQSLLLPQETLVDAEQAVVRRVYQPRSDGQLPVRNVVVILMESLAARYVGALGDSHNITPCFDELSKKGLLFRNFLANGTHTHQGIFATMTSFPNLPGYEYLMQMSEGSHDFSGLAPLLKLLGYEDLYVYNGDFAWDNQLGFFRRQGFQNFIGRNDYVNPVVKDPTWGVSDQDMFDRAAKELASIPRKKPFFALLQTLSNHTPYALPNPLPVPAVTTAGSLNAHLTAMRYADWALGRFFAAIEKQPFFQETLFVIVGDHGFANSEQLTELDLNRFHVPLLLVAPGIQKRYGSFCDRVGSQVDIVPTILGRLGHNIQHQCWGRDLLALSPFDAGFAVIKPSGSDQTVGLVQGNRLLVWPQSRQPLHFQIDLRKHQAIATNPSPEESRQSTDFLQAYIESASHSLRQNTAGIASAQEKTL
ncbi:MAG: LTA synthase family protein [Porticoccaceae bacterium]|jgi:phosphoglycerol transferase MdoB-like AlkP superfamily enzyme|uniref:LTA synthase family protein n=1 Tax=Desulfuromonas thiophila TaxID=57664 RepID=UPI00243B61EA|nr:LTA synthase family protein [Desulfuromonas thiophila]MCB5285984.1 LTA synthase family protein [Candidatus Cloacimonadota bacterium]MCK9172425.1 LTA synthase family protein [Desulfuromonas thiophila]MDY0368022.1 LTA synthase family protein [Candidatus Syntrophosphaera sp.]